MPLKVMPLTLAAPSISVSEAPITAAVPDAAPETVAE